MDCDTIFFSGHAIRRMFERSIGRADVVEVIQSGEIIVEYPYDEPFPSQIILGLSTGRTLHVVVARDDQTDTCYVITAYEPNPALWEADFRTRRPR
jgi:hypothetical protein